MQVLSICNDFLRAEILPEIGAGLSRLDWLTGGVPLPVLRPLAQLSGAVPPDPNQLACYPLVPWSNRIGAGAFFFDGRWVRLTPNLEGEPYPIHGDGWQHAWQLGAQSASAVTLTFERQHGGPFCYRANLTYRLQGPMLVVTLEVENTGAQVLPFGLGLHPWLPRSKGVMLRAPARAVWQSGEDHLPLAQMPIPEQWRFDRLCALPRDQVDHAFSGWDGRADVVWPETGLRLTLEADMSYYVLYAPLGADFFCFEPVDHPINAHNMPGGATSNGLTLLGPQQQLQRQFHFGVSQGVSHV